MKKTKILPFLFCVLIISSILTVSAQTILNVTVTTDKQSYNRGDIVSVSGALLANSQPATGLVGLLLSDSANNDLALRTISAGPVNNQLGAVTAVFLSDNHGNPVSSASAGSLAYFTITVVNKDSAPRDLYAYISVYDNNGVPLTSGFVSQQHVASNEQLTGTISMPIPSWAAAGNDYVYGELFSNFPDQGGIPLAQEMSVQYTLTGVIHGSNQPSISSGSQGSYAIAFKLPARAAIGNYNVHISSASNGLVASNIASFTVNQPGDFNGDGVIDFNDLIGFANAWIAYNSNQPWSHVADLNNDGKVDFNDLILFANAWIVYNSVA
jgi:hypothetical protein